jgi:hypothetical protein
MNMVRSYQYGIHISNQYSRHRAGIEQVFHQASSKDQTMEQRIEQIIEQNRTGYQVENEDVSV